jgi:hypothetical protein
VFHNPYARHPVPHELLPEATHWFEHDGEKICSWLNRGPFVMAGDDFLDSKITSLVGARNTICCRSVLLRKHSCTPYMHSPYFGDARANVALTAMVRFQRRALLIGEITKNPIDGRTGAANPAGV